MSSTPQTSAQPLTIDQALAKAREHQFAGRLHDAEVLYRNILTKLPNHPEATHMLGVLAYQAGHARSAIDLIKRAIKLSPESAEYVGSLGLVQVASGDFQGALDSCKQAIRLRPTYPDAHNNMANALFNLGRLEEAVGAYKMALKYKPDFPEVCSNLGNALTELKRIDEAVAACKKAVALKPLFPDAHYNLGNAYYAGHMFEYALAAYRQSVALRPGFPKAWNNLGNVLKDQGYNDQAMVAYEESIKAGPMPMVDSNRVYLMVFQPNRDAQTILAETKKWSDRYAKGLSAQGTKRKATLEPGKKLRVGYLSPDFRDHVVGRNILPLIRGHDREKFEIFCYANSGKPDAFGERFKKTADHYRSVLNLSDEACAKQIMDDGIDILVDLALHMAATRLLVMARKPAPIQVTFGGYPGTTGLPAIDYRLTDPYLDPPGELDENYSEKSIRLPHSFWCYDPDAMGIRDEELTAPPSVEKGYITFGCLNNFCKVNDGVLELWAQVMNRVEGSRLLVLTPPGPPRRRVIDKFDREGIAPDRLTFTERLINRNDYMKLYRQIDIGLDTFPYNGHTTSLDSLWMGVPVVTMVGKTVVGRAGWSQLGNLDLKDLAADSPEKFIEIAERLADDFARLKELRETIREKMLRSPLCDAKGFTCGIEAAYLGMVASA